MRAALRSKGQAQRQQITGSQSFPAPVGGWNARDALAAMPSIDAVYMINMFPQTSYCESRGGSDAHATGITGTVQTLATYNALSGTNKMFAATSSGVWDVTAAGAVGSAESVTSTEGKWQTANFGDGTNNYLMMVNGTDKALYYNGSAWITVDGASTPALTGVATTSLIHVMVYQGRLFFIQKDSLSFWYLAAGAAGGALTEFDLSSVCKQGGQLMAMATWTFDGGAGPDDYAVFVTSKGEIAVYTGTNPSVAANWSLKGVYFLGQPLSRRCFVNYGGDLVLITQNGAYPLAAALQSATIDKRLSLTNKIETAFTKAARLYGDNFGWEAILYPAQNALLFNVPVDETGSQEQYVMNTTTKSWCSFNAWGAQTFGLLNGELYYGEAGQVTKAWTGTDDQGSNIVIEAKQAFSYFGQEGREKRFVLFRPVFSANGNLSFLTGLDVDFRDEVISGEATYNVTSAGVWDTAIWDTSYWAANLEVIKEWTSPQRNVGYCAAGKIKIATNLLTIQWMSSDFVYEIGGVL